jgi:hypothetical protein
LSFVAPGRKAVPFAATPAIAILIIVTALAPAAAQTGPADDANHRAATAAPAGGAVRLTGKERLGEKWRDEQRIDNCKVAADKRGSRPRPDSCAPAR